LQGIKKRLIINYLIVILLTIVFLESFLISAISRYYYDNISQLLNKQGIISSNFYNQYLYDKDLYADSLELLQIFSQNTTAQVQIVDKSGIVIEDSSFLVKGEKLETSDIEKSLRGSPGSLTGYSEDTDESIMAVSYPLLSNGEVIGVVRYVSTLKYVNSTIIEITCVVILAGLIILVIVVIVSIFLSSTITKPIMNITAAASKMAKGEFSTRAKVPLNDEIGKLADTLNFMAGEITRNEELKNDFVSSISHEIRTPLTSIKGWAVTLRTGSLEDKAEMLDGLEIIERESDRLTSLVEELLDFSKFESGQITLSKSEVDLVRLLNYIKRHLDPRASRQNINFFIETDKDIPLIKCDENRLKQVLINLLDNSFKFTQEGGSIKITLTRDTYYAKISVEDTGIGIDKNDLNRVTEKFYKGKESKYGSGLGLSISKQIVELHKGSLIIESTPSCGTIVHVRLPI
jgi:signal transduction histidine kinase